MALTSALFAFLLLTGQCPLTRVTNLTMTYFTCPGRQTRAPEGRALQERQTPINICGPINNGEVFDGLFTFTCNQTSGNLPKLGDCNIIDGAIVDSFLRPMPVTIPALSGVVMTLLNNTCAFVFPNDDANDIYDICFQNMPDLGFNIMEECPTPQHDGFVGSVRSPVQPGVQNWELQSSSHNNDSYCWRIYKTRPTHTFKSKAHLAERRHIQIKVPPLNQSQHLPFRNVPPLAGTALLHAVTSRLFLLPPPPPPKPPRRGIETGFLRWGLPSCERGFVSHRAGRDFKQIHVEGWAAGRIGRRREGGGARVDGGSKTKTRMQGIAEYFCTPPVMSSALRPADVVLARGAHILCPFDLPKVGFGLGRGPAWHCRPLQCRESEVYEYNMCGVYLLTPIQIFGLRETHRMRRVFCRIFIRLMFFKPSTV
ncbi:hypothetical protein B0H10DRAFT_1950962 [Mycena sp. CBHHK59/15]|nr:hypothetical protein B0H10DRAFT_1950962 [Mycena sp. CBHHK59/15]